MGTPARISVIGLGNVLLGDDGFGPFVIELLRAGWTFPDGVTLMDAGTPGLDLVDYLQGYQSVIVVDAIALPAPAGSVRTFRGDEVRRLLTRERISAHDPALGEALLLAELAGDAPSDVVLIGTVPAQLGAGPALSVPVRQAARLAARQVVAEVAGRRLTPVPLVPAREPAAWWLR